MGNRPVNYVSWADAARFSNWMHNGMGAGGTESGAYNMTVAFPLREATAKWFVPTTDEFYKAAYYDPAANGGLGGYWNFATRTDTTPTGVQVVKTGELGIPGDGRVGADGGLTPVVTGNYANTAGSGTGYRYANVGTSGGPSAYGTFDQTSNIGEWSDTPDLYDPAPPAARLYRQVQLGNAWASGNAAQGDAQQAQTQYLYWDNANSYGFRMAAEVPEPSTLILMASGLLGLLAYAWRRRRV